MKKMSKRSKETGFTLVEVLASVVILSIILLGVLSLFTTTNQIANSNNSKIVAINLGKATLERVKAETESFFDVSSFLDSENSSLEMTKERCNVSDCEELYKININDKEYLITLLVEKEEELHLLNVLVEVKLPNENVAHQLEGYVSYDTTPE